MAYLDTGELPWGMDLFDTCQDEVSNSFPPVISIQQSYYPHKDR